MEKVKHPDNYAGRFSCLLLHKAKLEKYPFMSLKNLLLQSGRIDPESNESFKTDNKIFTGSSWKDKCLSPHMCLLIIIALNQSFNLSIHFFAIHNASIILLEDYRFQFYYDYIKEVCEAISKIPTAVERYQIAEQIRKSKREYKGIKPVYSCEE